MCTIGLGLLCYTLDSNIKDLYRHYEIVFRLVRDVKVERISQTERHTLTSTQCDYSAHNYMVIRVSAK